MKVKMLVAMSAIGLLTSLAYADYDNVVGANNGMSGTQEILNNPGAMTDSSNTLNGTEEAMNTTGTPDANNLNSSGNGTSADTATGDDDY